MNARESKQRIERLERQVKALEKLLIQVCIIRDRYAGFADNIAKDYRDTIWQPDWHELKARAEGLREWDLRFRREFERDNPEVSRDA